MKVFFILLSVIIVQMAGAHENSRYTSHLQIKSVNCDRSNKLIIETGPDLVGISYKATLTDIESSILNLCEAIKPLQQNETWVKIRIENEAPVSQTNIHYAELLSVSLSPFED